MMVFAIGARLRRSTAHVPDQKLGPAMIQLEDLLQNLTLASIIGLNNRVHRVPAIANGFSKFGFDVHRIAALSLLARGPIARGYVG
jgi:hypothetical protein